MILETKSITILIADIDRIVKATFKKMLKEDNYSVLEASSGQQVLKVIERQKVAMIICGQELKDMAGLDLLVKVEATHPEIARIMLDGNLDQATYLRAINIGHVNQFIPKPWEKQAIMQLINTLAERYQLQQEEKKLNLILLEQHEQLTEKHEGMRQDLQLGTRIHETLLLGKIPQKIPGFSIEAIAIPSKEIDGDFYEFYHASPNVLDVVIGDVMGKGLPAALVGTAIKMQLMRFALPFTHHQVFEHDGTWVDDLLLPREIIAHVHRELISQLIELEYFVSIFYGRFNLFKRTFTYVDCGSTKTIHYRSNLRNAVPLMGNNCPMGVLEKSDYQDVEVPYEKGDYFIFYSDGLTETQSPSGELYGHERLINIAEKNPTMDASALLRMIKASVSAFAQRTTFQDDLTILIVRITDIPYSEIQTVTAVRFKSDLESLKAVRTYVTRACRKLPRQDKDFTALLQLALNEAFCNIVQHGYKGENKGDIVIQSHIDKEGIAFEISDQGAHFDPSLVPEPSLAGDQERGFGWYFIKEIVDQVNYVHKETEAGWNHLRIYKKFMSEGTKMQFAHAQQGNILIVTPEMDSLDAKDSNEFKEKVMELIKTSGLNKVIFDLRRVQFIDSSGLGTFLSVLRTLHSHGGELKLACMSKPIRTMFELVSMHKIFEIFNSTDDALRSFK